jgi:hypothetical protein
VAWTNGDGAYLGNAAASGSYTITLDNSFTVGGGATTSPFNALTISGGSSGTNYTLDGSGTSGTGSYTLTAAGRIQDNGNLSLQNMTVNNTTYTQSGAGAISYVSDGATLNVNKGATVNGKYMAVGSYGGAGVININNGGSLTGYSTIEINSGSGSTGSALNINTGGSVALASASNLYLSDMTKTGTNGNSGTVNVDGGSLTVQAITVAANNILQTGTLNINSGTVTTTATAGITSKSGTNVGSPTIVNLNGGTLNATWIAATNNGDVTVNFNGGTLQSHAGGGIGAPSSAYTIPTNMNVQAGGAIVDSNGHTYWLQTPLLHDAALGSTADGGLTVLDSQATGAQTTSYVTLQGTNTYTGPTVVQTGGDLVLAGAATASNSAVLAAGTIADSSSVTINSGGVLTLANNAAATQVKGLGINGGSLTFDLNSSQAPSLSIGSAANVSGVNTINIYALAGTASFTYGTYNLITDSFGGLSGGTFQFGNGQQTAVAGPLSGGSSYLLTLGSTDTAETLTISTVPEPAAMALLAAGGIGLLLLGRRRRPQA